MDISIIFEGFGISAGLIMAIGAQNAFVIKQGIKREHVFIVALLCSAIDFFLICSGVLGFGAIINAHPLILKIATWGGAAFLCWFGIRSILSAIHPTVLTDAELKDKSVQKSSSLKSVVVTILALSLLNPHVYLDTVVMLGSIGARHNWPDRLWFIIGACGASCIWFFGLGFAAGFLAPLFRKPITWRILDFIIASVMFFIAFQLILQALGSGIFIGTV